MEENRADFTENKDGENALDLEDYPRAYSIYSQALAQKPYGAQEGYLRTCLGESLLFQGRFSEAAKELKKANAIIDKMQPEFSDLRARVLDDTSWLKQAQNNSAGAIQYAKQALTVMQGVTNPVPTHQTELYLRLGILSQEAGRYDEAAKYIQQALNITTKALGDDDPQTADLKERLSGVLRLSGNSAEANKLYTEALKVKWRLTAIFDKYSPHSYTQTVTYRYYPGVTNCAVVQHPAPNTESISINGVTVFAALITTGKDLGKNTCRVDISLVNDTNRQVQLLPRSPELVALAPKVAIGHIINPTTLANKVEAKGNKSAKWVRFWGADATQTVNSTFIGNPGVWGYPPVTSYNGTIPIVTRSGNMTTVQTQVPDYMAQAQALQKAATIEAASREKANAIRSSMISQQLVTGGGNAAGSLYFDIADPTKAQLNVPVGNAIFEFDFPPVPQ
jgi:tetratricopeptide (TPR) repeat protein